MTSIRGMLLLCCGALAGSAVTLFASQDRTVTHRIPMFENEQVKVWKTVILPNSPPSMHRHEHGRTLVALTGGPVTIQRESGEKQTLDWKSGQAYWLDADPPGKGLHADVNLTRDPIEVMIVELKKDH